MNVGNYPLGHTRTGDAIYRLLGSRRALIRAVTPEKEVILPYLYDGYGLFWDHLRGQYGDKFGDSPDFTMLVWSKIRGFRKVTWDESGKMIYAEAVQSTANVADALGFVGEKMDDSSSGGYLFVFEHPKIVLGTPEVGIAFEEIFDEINAERYTGPARIAFVGQVGQLPPILQGFDAQVEVPMPEREDIIAILSRYMGIKVMPGKVVGNLLADSKKTKASVKNIMAEGLKVPPADVPESLVDEVKDLLEGEPTHGEVETLLSDRLGFRKVPAELVEVLLGLPFRQVGAIARTIATHRKDLSKAFHEAQKEKIRYFSTLMDGIEFKPVMEDPVPVVGMDAFIEDMNRLKAVINNPAANVSLAFAILLLGPPGTGKSASIDLMSHLLGLSVIQFQFSRILNSYVGESERQMQAVLDAIKAYGSVIVHLDEIEKQTPKLGGNDSGVSSRLLSMLLTFQQEVKNAGLPVIFVGTANYDGLRDLPPEFYDRWQMRYIVEAPDQDALAEIFRVHVVRNIISKDAVIEEGENGKMTASHERIGEVGYNVTELARRMTDATRTGKPVGRHVADAVAMACQEAVRQREADGWKQGEETMGIPTMEHLVYAIEARKDFVEVEQTGVSAKPVRASGKNNKEKTSEQGLLEFGG